MNILTFQLRAARVILNTGVREIGALLNVSRSTISLWENRPNNEPIKTSSDNIIILKNFFFDKNIDFPNSSSIKLITSSKNESGDLTRFHLRGARSIMNITQDKLANLLGAPLSLINYLESQPNERYLKDTPKYHEIEKFDLRSFFVNKGITFPKEFLIQLNN